MPRFNMPKLFLVEGNPHCLVMIAIAEFLKVEYEIKFIHFEERVVPFLNYDGKHLCCAKEIYRCLLKVSTLENPSKGGTKCIDQWLQWEATKLQPALMKALKRAVFSPRRKTGKKSQKINKELQEHIEYLVDSLRETTTSKGFARRDDHPGTPVLDARESAILEEAQVDVDALALERILKMNFNKEAGVQALMESNNDVEVAIESLLSGSIECTGSPSVVQADQLPHTQEDVVSLADIVLWASLYPVMSDPNLKAFFKDLQRSEIIIPIIGFNKAEQEKAEEKAAIYQKAKYRNLNQWFDLMNDRKECKKATKTKPPEKPEGMNIEALKVFLKSPMLKVKKIKVTGKAAKNVKVKGCPETKTLSYAFDIKLEADLRLAQPMEAGKNIRVGWVQGLNYIKNEAKYTNQKKQGTEGRIMVDFFNDAIFDSSGEVLPWLSMCSFSILDETKTTYKIKLLDTVRSVFHTVEILKQPKNLPMRLRRVYEANHFSAFLIAMDMDTKETQELRQVQWKFETNVDVRYDSNSHYDNDDKTLKPLVKSSTQSTILGLKVPKIPGPLSHVKCIFDNKVLKGKEDTLNKNFRETRDGALINSKKTVYEEDAESESGESLEESGIETDTTSGSEEDFTWDSGTC